MRLGLFVFCLCACSGHPAGGDADADSDLDCSDRDADGYAETGCEGGGDCQDDDADVHPGVADDTWLLETAVADVQLTRPPALAVDTSSKPRIVYYAGESQGAALPYLATREAGEWTSEAFLQEDGAFEGPFDIEIDVEGVFHVLSWTAEGTMYIFGSGDAWTRELVASDATGRPSFDLDTSQQPHLAYMKSDGSLSYAARTGGWSIETIPTSCDVGEDPSIAVDGGGVAHVAFIQFCSPGKIHTSRAYYATNASGAWEVEPIADEWGDYVVLAVESDGTPHVIFSGLGGLEEPAGPAWYARREAGAWTIEMLARGAPVLDLESDGTVDAFFPDYDSTLWRLSPGGEWQTEVLLPGSSGVPFSAIRAAADGIHIAFIQGWDLRYLHQEAPNGVDDDCNGVVW